MMKGNISKQMDPGVSQTSLTDAQGPKNESKRNMNFKPLHTHPMHGNLLYSELHLDPY